MDARDSTAPGRFLLVTADFGGNVPPALGLCRLLTERGHDVRVLAPGRFRERIGAAGGAFRPFPPSLEWDPAKGRALEDQHDFWEEITGSLVLATAVLDEVEADPPGALVVDCMLDNAQWAAEAAGVATAVFVHSMVDLWMDLSYYERWDEWRLRADETRSRLGLGPLDPRPSLAPMWERLDRVVILLPPELDSSTLVPSNARYVGPAFEEDHGAVTWDSPWPTDDPNPLVVVSLGSTYMHHEEELQRTIDAVATLPVRALVTTGFGLDPDEVDAPAHVHLTSFVPHGAVLPHASMVLTHAGMSTVLTACAFGVPMLCMPLGRDQPEIAERVEALGAGRRIAKDATVEDIRTGIQETLASEQLRTGARRMAEVIARYRDGELAVTELEGLLSRGS